MKELDNMRAKLHSYILEKPFTYNCVGVCPAEDIKFQYYAYISETKFWEYIDKIYFTCDERFMAFRRFHKILMNHWNIYYMDYEIIKYKSTIEIHTESKEKLDEIMEEILFNAL